jgi:hypothetical protein
MNVRTLALVTLSLIALASPSYAAPGAVLRGLDKTTGIAKDFVAPVGKHVKFGTLDVVSRACVKRPPEETPEVSAYLEISDTPYADADKPTPEKKQMFSGWMFWSSPALNALQHPSYDVWVIDCKS